MSDLHARLLAELDTIDRLLVHKVRFVNALRAVVELHEPTHFLRRPLDVPICETCSTDDDLHDRPWPCSTIRTIAEALGVPEGDQS